MISNSEIINRFDVLYNNTMSNQAPSLDAYEMSVFFNKAQLEVLKNHLNPKGNKYGEGFDGSSKRLIDFSNLIVTRTYVFKNSSCNGIYNLNAWQFSGVEVVKTETLPINDTEAIDITVSDIIDIDWNNDVLSIINEEMDVLPKDLRDMLIEYMGNFSSSIFDGNGNITIITQFIDWILLLNLPLDDPILLVFLEQLRGAINALLKGDEALINAGFNPAPTVDEAIATTLVKPYVKTIVPINNVEYDTLMSRPYKFPPRSQVWRINTNGHPEFILPPTEGPVRYRMRYVKLPKEIDLGDNNDVPEVPETLIDEVLQRAVELAKNSWEGNIETTKALGERSE